MFGHVVSAQCNVSFIIIIGSSYMLHNCKNNINHCYKTIDEIKTACIEFLAELCHNCGYIPKYR